jgi:hypothetical protein
VLDEGVVWDSTASKPSLIPNLCQCFGAYGPFPIERDVPQRGDERTRRLRTRTIQIIGIRETVHFVRDLDAVGLSYRRPISLPCMSQDFRICADEVAGCSIVKSVQEIGSLARTSLPMESSRGFLSRLRAGQSETVAWLWPGSRSSAEPVGRTAASLRKSRIPRLKLAISRLWKASWLGHPVNERCAC